MHYKGAAPFFFLATEHHLAGKPVNPLNHLESGTAAVALGLTLDNLLVLTNCSLAVKLPVRKSGKGGQRRSGPGLLERSNLCYLLRRSRLSSA